MSFLGVPASGWQNHHPIISDYAAAPLPTFLSRGKFCRPTRNAPFASGKPSVCLTQTVFSCRVKKPETYLVPKDGKANVAGERAGGQPMQVAPRGLSTRSGTRAQGVQGKEQDIRAVVKALPSPPLLQSPAHAGGCGGCTNGQVQGQRSRSGVTQQCLLQLWLP